MTFLPCALAVDMGGTNLRGAVMDGEGRLHARREAAVAKNETAGIDQIVSLCEKLRTDARKLGMEPRGIGLALPGFLDLATETVRFSPNLRHLGGLNLRKILSERLGLPCAVENDGNCAALGEWWVGNARGCQHVVTLTLGTGVGGGLISEGQLIRGVDGSGGEVGHICIDSNGPPCLCGSNGCLEAFASGGALERETGMPAQRLFEKAKEGDAEAIAVFQRMGGHLGRGIATFCVLFDPEIVTLGGKLSRAAEFFLPSLYDELRRRLANHPSQSVRLVVSQQGDDAGLIGAGWISLNRA